MTEIVRKPLLIAPVNQRVSEIDVREIIFEGGQRTGRHLHPCPVVGYIVEGSAVFQIEGRPPQTLIAGSAFYEPANTVVVRFDNGSDAQPMKFIAYYLRQGQEALIEMLPE